MDLVLVKDHFIGFDLTEPFRISGEDFSEGAASNLLFQIGDDGIAILSVFFCFLGVEADHIADSLKGRFFHLQSGL